MMKGVPQNRKQFLQSFLLGGLLPVIAFTVIEESWGTIPALIGGMVFGVGELIYEKCKAGQIQKLTWFGNGALILLGGVSLITSEGIWFKLQPAMMEALMAGVLWGSCLWKKPLLVSLGRAQGAFDRVPESLRPAFERIFARLTVRVGFFFAVHAALASWAAFYWSTTAWAWLKGLGFTGSFIVYMVGEGIWLRFQFRRLVTTQSIDI